MNNAVIKTGHLKVPTGCMQQAFAVATAFLSSLEHREAQCNNELICLHMGGHYASVTCREMTKLSVLSASKGIGSLILDTRSGTESYPSL